MRKVLRYSFFALVLGLAASTFSVTGARAQNVIGETLRRMDTNNKSLQSMRADVTMAKYNPQLRSTDIYTGTTSYLPQTRKQKRYMRLDWVKPQTEQISVIGDDYELYKPSINQVFVGKVQNAKSGAGAGNVLSFMSMSREELKANYAVQFIAEEQIKGGTPTVHLMLTPKVRTSYKTAELWVDADGMPRQARVTEHNDDTTTVLLENIRKNETIKGSSFKLNYPSSVKKVKP